MLSSQKRTYGYFAVQITIVQMSIGHSNGTICKPSVTMPILETLYWTYLAVYQNFTLKGRTWIALKIPEIYLTAYVVGDILIWSISLLEWFTSHLYLYCAFTDRPFHRFRIVHSGGGTYRLNVYSYARPMLFLLSVVSTLLILFT